MIRALSYLFLSIILFNCSEKNITDINSENFESKLIFGVETDQSGIHDFKEFNDQSSISYKYYNSFSADNLVFRIEEESDQLFEYDKNDIVINIKTKYDIEKYYNSINCRVRGQGYGFSDDKFNGFIEIQIPVTLDKAMIIQNDEVLNFDSTQDDFFEIDVYSYISKKHLTSSLRITKDN